MPTLIIHTPYSQIDLNEKRSFSQTVEKSIGYGYAISNRLFKQLSPGDPVVVICKEHRKQAEGQLQELKPTEKAENGMQRYDVLMANLKTSEYTHENTKLERTGVQVL